MMLLRIILSAILLCTISSGTNAQYIYEILDYSPAPGQHINGTAGTPEAALSIIGTATGLVSLGAFGGSITFRFEFPVANNPENPFGIDFTIFGNSIGDWSEPGIVSVMKDENMNGLADDRWFELAGSEYHTENCQKNYKVTYTNPGGETATDLSWVDNHGDSGFIYANPVHSQTYYPKSSLFPDISQTSYTLSGTRIYAGIDSSDNTLIHSPPLAYGYADNHNRGRDPFTLPDNPATPEVEGAGGDPMDISWAVDSSGQSVHIDTIHFVRIYTAVNGHAGILGEISTEISGAAIVDVNTSFRDREILPPQSDPYKLYPNPITNLLYIEGPSPASYKILSTSGQVQKEDDFIPGMQAQDLSFLPPGMYILQIYSAWGTESKIFLKH